MEKENKIHIGFKKFKRAHIIKNSKNWDMIIKEKKQEGVVFKETSQMILKLKKYQIKNQEPTDIWSIAESYNSLPEDIESKRETTNLKLEEKPNLKQDILKEMLGFKLKRLNKAGRRTPKEMWKRIRYLSKGLTLDEWSDRMENSWEDMLEYSEKLWENFLFYSLKKYKWYPYTQKFWSDSWYGQNWRNWRREEDAVTWQLNSRTPWHKHIRLSNDVEYLTQKGQNPWFIDNKKNYTFPKNAETIIGSTRLKLNNQIFTNTNRQELIKQGTYNTDHVETNELNSWNDTANIYLKYIRPWLMRLNFMDKPSLHNYGMKYLGKEQHKKNFEVVPQVNIFESEVYQIAYNLKIIKQITNFVNGITSSKNIKEMIERKFGKRNTKLYIKNKDKLTKLINYEKLLHFRQTNQNLSAKNTKNNYALLLPTNLNKTILIIFIIIHYFKK